MKNFFLITFLFIFGCAPTPEPLPEWILHTKNDSKNWSSVGVGLTRDIAIKQAMNSIAAQISIQIESNMKSIKVERNFELEEFSRFIIESRINISLPQVQIIEVIKVENTWYANATLNKNKYFKNLEEKRGNAKTMAVQLLKSAQNQSKIEALQSIFQAYDEIKDFLDYPLIINFNNNPNTNLYSEIITKFRDCIQAISIKPEAEYYKFKSILPIRKHIPITVNTKDDQSPNGLPFIVKFSSGRTNSKLYANENLMQLIIEEISPQKPSDVISIQLDIPSILNLKTVPKSFRMQSKTEITIEILPLNFYIQSNEYNLGNELIHKKIYPIVSQFIIDNYSGIITNNKKDCDLIVRLDMKTYKGNNGQNDWGIYKTFADFKMQVFAKYSNQELFNYSINQVQGGDFESHENAGSQAINNLATQLENEILPLFNESIIQI